MPTLDDLVRGMQVVAVVCNQWGDTGKGKFSDYFAAQWADVIARGTGGNNAGHTTVINNKKRIFHLIPAGIVYDKEGKINVLGNGMVIDLEVLCSELDELDSEGMTYNNLMISEDAQAILPFQIDRDRKRNQPLKDGGIGSTGRGIGPCYGDKTLRKGVFIRDLFDEDTLRNKLETLKREYYQGFDINIDKVIAELKPFAERIKPFVRDTIAEMHRFYREGKKILLEGAQGLLLSIEFGTVPYATTSDCSLNGTASGAGISAKLVDLPLGIVKFPYMTRVGNGPFPSEYGGLASEEYCAAGLEHDMFYEVREYLGMDLNLSEIRRFQKTKDTLALAMHEKKVVDYIKSHREKVVELINSDDPFIKGVGIRIAGAEYGATTKRPRRTGMTDLVALRRAMLLNGPNIVLTKPDVLQGAKEFELVDGYELDGMDIGFTRDCGKLRRVQVRTKRFAGFNDDLASLTDYNDVPSGLKEAKDYMESFTRGRVRIMSTGADQSETIIIK